MGDHEDTILHNMSDTPEDDSLADFKSPKQSCITKLTESNNSQRRKTTRKLKSSAKSQKELNKQRLEKKRSFQNTQPLIESSFFKSKSSSDNEAVPNMQVALVCPLCFKTFKGDDSRVLHMKICAFRNNIPTNKLLEAIELQNWQEDERKSLGLLAGPAVQGRKRPVVTSRQVSSEQSDFELALALSKSLQEAEELDTINECDILHEVPGQFMTDVTESAHQEKKRARLERFGFANSKPPVAKTRRRRRNEITVLQTRTEEERNRILTDKISEILMGNEPITQNQKTEIKRNVVKREIRLLSPLLQEIYDKEKELWNKAKLTLGQKCFYVSDLSKFISPQEKEIDDVDLNFPDDVYNIELNEYKKEEVRSVDKIYQVSSIDTNEDCKNCRNNQFTNTVIANWSSILNDSSASDVIICVQNDKHIWTHRLVFYVQCPNVLLDVTPNKTSEFPKEKIDWTDVPYDAALAFLEFIYCGIIKNYAHVLENVSGFTTLRNLARKYKTEELFAFLQRKEVEMKGEKSDDNETEKLISKETDNINWSNNNVHNLVHDSENSELDENDKFSKEGSQQCITRKTESVTKEVTNDNEHKSELLKGGIDLSEISILQNTNLSLDLFDDSNISIKSNETKNKTKCYMHEIDVEKIKEVDEFNMLDSNSQKSELKSEDTVIYKNVEDDADSLQDVTHFTTPKTSRCSDAKNNKNDLSIFIEKCRKENAKSISDLDSGISVTLTPPKPNRNPFHIDQDDSSDAAIKGAFKDKHGLSVFDSKEDSCLKDMATPTVGTDIDTHVDLDGSEDDVRSKSNTEEGCRSKNSSMNSSIIDDEKKFEDEEIHSIFRNSQHKSTRSLANTESEDDATYSDFDTTGIEMSMYSKYKKTHKDNSIIKYRSFVKKHVLPNNVKDCKLDECKESNNMDNDILSLSDTDTEPELSLVQECSQTEVKRSSFNSKEYERTPRRDSCEFINERLTDDRNSCSSANSMSPNIIEDSVKETEKDNLRTLRYSKSESYIDLEVMKKRSLDSNVNERKTVVSPVLISSSPEFDFDDSGTYNCDEINKNKNVPRTLNFDDIFENSIYLANVHIDNHDDDSDTLTLTRKADKGDVCDAKVNKTRTLSKVNYSFVENSKQNGKSAIVKKDSVRKFQKKSVSETSLQINTKNNKNYISQVYSNSQCIIKKNANSNRSPEFIRDSVTPPPNYNDMNTPQLCAEMNKYGLKPQKRKRAVQLLTYIYDQLHPIVSGTSKNVESELSIISSEDDEPPMKRVNHTNNDGDNRSQLSLSHEKDAQNPLFIIDEEKQFDDAEFTPLTDNALSIKEMFLKIINIKKDLHNKILAYEPLCITSLHTMLKEAGFKCKINALMDFLDEQCITFYVQDAKQRKEKRHYT